MINDELGARGEGKDWGTMAIQRLTAFEAEADIFGRLRRVSFNADNGALLIECIGVDEAATIIDHLSTGGIKSTKANDLPVAPAMPASEKKVLEDNPIEPSAAEAEPAKPAAKPKSAKASTKAPKPKRSKKPAAKAAPEAEPEAEDEHSVMDDMEAATDPAKQGEDWVSNGAEAEELAAAEAEKEAAIESSKGGELPAELLKAKKLRDAVGILFEDMSITHPDAIIAKCEEIQSQVPVLKRIKGNLKERVARTISILEIGT
jgi:type IV secretory pathway VirB10-like protein